MAGKKTALLVLADGASFAGTAIGAPGETFGEVCFNTGMTGYQEIFTDPSYAGQIMAMTNSHIGNYGAVEAEAESSGVKIAGLVCRNFAEAHSRAEADSLQEYLERFSLTGIADVDTRALVRHIRAKGAMNAAISHEETNPEVLLKRLKETCPDMEGLELASGVSTPELQIIVPENPRCKVAALDLGIKQNLINSLTARGCEVMLFPARSEAKELLDAGAGGFFLSNGPGDPQAMDYAIETTRALIDSGKPVFGVCMGHQLMALANDVPTFKMHFGHRGINHPVLNLRTGKSEITSQNHGFAVESEAALANDTLEITHFNLNDKSVEGLRMKNRPVFSVQYHPEANPGPHDSRYLFDDFVEMMT